MRTYVRTEIHLTHDWIRACDEICIPWNSSLRLRYSKYNRVVTAYTLDGVRVPRAWSKVYFRRTIDIQEKTKLPF